MARPRAIDFESVLPHNRMVRLPADAQNVKYYQTKQASYVSYLSAGHWHLAKTVDGGEVEPLLFAGSERDLEQLINKLSDVNTSAPLRQSSD